MNKKMNLQTKVLCALGAVYVLECASMLKVVRKERGKRKKIREWELMNSSAIRASKERLMRMVADPESTPREILVALEEEQEFLKIIQNQPMY